MEGWLVPLLLLLFVFQLKRLENQPRNSPTTGEAMILFVAAEGGGGGGKGDWPIVDVTLWRGVPKMVRRWLLKFV